MTILFDHEKLEVYQESLVFCGWVGKLLATISSKAAAKDQLDRASTSIPLNIAEGNGKFSGRIELDFSRSPAVQPWSAPLALMCWSLGDWRARARLKAGRSGWCTLFAC